MCLHHQYSCSPPTLIIKKNLISSISVCWAVVWNTGVKCLLSPPTPLYLSPPHTHTPPHILQHLENGSSRFQHSKQLTMTCLLLAQFCCIFCSPSSLPVFQAAVTAPPFVSGTHTHKCVLTPLRVEVMLAAGGHHEKTRKTRRGKKAGEEYQQGRRFNSTAAAWGEALYLHRS